MKTFEIIHTASFEVVKNDVSRKAAAKKQLSEANKRYDFVFAGEVTSQYVAGN